MNNLSNKVLSKIQNLISQIDRSNSPQKQPRNQKIQNEPDISEISNQMAYSNLNHQRKTLTKNINKAYQQQQPQTSFKIVNKRTHSILNKKSHPPIYQRVNQILARKKMNIQLMEQSILEKEEASMRPQKQNEERNRRIQRVMTQAQLQDFRKGCEERNKKRLEKKHIQQLSRIQKEVLIPYPNVGNTSRSLSKKYNLKKKYSENVFTRLSQDTIDRNSRMNYLKNKITQEEGGFSPIINSKSRALLEQSKTKTHNCDLEDSSCHKRCKTPPNYTPLKKKNLSSFLKSPLSVSNNTERVKTKQFQKSKDKSKSKTPQKNKLQSPKKTKILEQQFNLNKSMNKTTENRHPPLRLNLTDDADKSKDKCAQKNSVQRTLEVQSRKIIGKNKPLKADYIQVSPLYYHKCPFHDYNRSTQKLKQSMQNSLITKVWVI